MADNYPKTHDPVTGEYIGPSEKVITLKRPVKAGAESLSTLTLQEPTANDLARQVAKERETNNELEGGILLIALCSGTSPAIAGSLGKRDFEEALDFLQGFSKILPANASAGSGTE